MEEGGGGGGKDGVSAQYILINVGAFRTSCFTPRIIDDSVNVTLVYLRQREKVLTTKKFLVS